MEVVQNVLLTLGIAGLIATGVAELWYRVRNWLRLGRLAAAPVLGGRKRLDEVAVRENVHMVREDRQILWWILAGVVSLACLLAGIHGRGW